MVKYTKEIIMENFCKQINQFLKYGVGDNIYPEENNDKLEYDVCTNNLNFKIPRSKDEKKKDYKKRILEILLFIENTKIIDCEKFEEIEAIWRQCSNKDKDGETLKNALERIYFKDETPNRRVLDIIHKEKISLCFNKKDISDELQCLIKNKCRELNINVTFK